MALARIIGSLSVGDDGAVSVSISVSSGQETVDVPLQLEPSDIPADGPEALFTGTEPVCLQSFGDLMWAFRGKQVLVKGDAPLTHEEKKLEVAAVVLQRERRYKEVRRQLQYFSLLADADAARRQPIAERVKLFVWRRDQGKCALCGSQEKLEFDHIIPVSKGGSDTERNIQLLCETCNRAKGAGLASPPRSVP